MLATTLLAFAATVGIYLRLRHEFPRSITITTLVLILGATPVAWYAVFEPSLPGLVGLTATAACGAVVARTRAELGSPTRLRFVAWLGLCAIPIVLILWTTPAGELNLSRSHWLEVLFSSRRGFLALTPVAYLAVVGTLLYLRRDRTWSIAAIALLLASAWLVGASATWLREPAFGDRSLLSLLVLLAPGLAYLIDLARRHPVIALTPLVALAILWNHLLMVQYTVGMLPKDEPVNFARLVRQQADLQPRMVPLYPFAFPANLWFAWREGVPVDRYELLVMEPRRSAVELVLDRTAERFLLEGWSGPTAEGDHSGWWIGEREASVVVPFALGDARFLRVTLAARTRFEEPAVIADVAVLLNGRELGTFSPAATEISEVQFIVPASTMRNGFNRITFVSRGTRPANPSAARPHGPLTRRSGRAVWPVAVYKVMIGPA